jgi:hypothetical protein
VKRENARAGEHAADAARGARPTARDARENAASARRAWRSRVDAVAAT